ncbi:uncharacterized protein LOC131244158 [Magnolia sinica]|uniref:uncharacterized protein LOC131244158 n=1 Tax=Magnolia sinica TaxID=86752 RepID=UPI002659BBE3|nr:uncharacterized protein LOC131244158 [Magnolia sinica]
MHPSDRQKMTFVIDKGLYYYRVMPFGLKNAGATYQRLVNQMFAKQIGQTMEVYVNDMLVKSIRASNHIADLGETFLILQEYRMKLNPSKCAFGVGLGKFLGFQVSQRSIEANPKKIKALLDMSLPQTTKEIQCLTEWVSISAVSFALIKDVGGRKYPVYYVSKAMVPAEIRYPSMEKLALSLVLSARRLRPYFQAHTIVVLTNSPLRQVLPKPEVSGQLTKWPIELGEFDIRYWLRTAIKGQTMADFIAEFTTLNTEMADADSKAIPTTSPDPPLIQDVASDSERRWILYVDGSSNSKRARARIVLVAPDSTSIQYAIRIGFKASNNEAEYDALLAGLKLAASLRVHSLEVRCDSQLVINHISTEYWTKETKMVAYLAEARKLIEKFWSCIINQISRTENSWADALARLASTIEGKILRIVLMKFLDSLSIDEDDQEMMNLVETTPS